MLCHTDSSTRDCRDTLGMQPILLSALLFNFACGQVGSPPGKELFPCQSSIAPSSVLVAQQIPDQPTVPFLPPVAPSLPPGNLTEQPQNVPFLPPAAPPIPQPPQFGAPPAASALPYGGQPPAGSFPVLPAPAAQPIYSEQYPSYPPAPVANATQYYGQDGLQGQATKTHKHSVIKRIAGDLGKALEVGAGVAVPLGAEYLMYRMMNNSGYSSGYPSYGSPYGAYPGCGYGY